MGNYLLLFIDGKEPEDEAEMARYLKAWETWFANLGENVVDGGNPFTSGIKSVAANGAVSDGPVGARATGYAIIRAGSLDAATDAARACPHLQAGGPLTVYEIYSEA